MRVLLMAVLITAGAALIRTIRDRFLPKGWGWELLALAAAGLAAYVLAAAMKVQP